MAEAIVNSDFTMQLCDELKKMKESLNVVERYVELMEYADSRRGFAGNPDIQQALTQYDNAREYRDLMRSRMPEIEKFLEKMKAKSKTEQRVNDTELVEEQSEKACKKHSKNKKKKNSKKHKSKKRR